MIVYNYAGVPSNLLHYTDVDSLYKQSLMGAVVSQRLLKSSPSLESRSAFIQKIFEVWQDLAYEAIGTGTAWGYAILFTDIARTLGISEHRLSKQLTRLEVCGLKLTSGGAALTFQQSV
ncbi:hypothetical protein [Leptolyngbya sp. FACHB-261]|uniref:hypothetical protein n=1 Tax=Leptolyngbya sp. FACHB-261 TaxID=2692806 RepID=UPI001688077E|nr:hypothetical protein [Leptolyngbya sp. FACHB-261]MBD2100813.1 hypothetical protein [Leptolyngbya sp. FACHB-261]